MVSKGGSMGQLTTHILDTANGTPAAGVDIRLYALDGDRSLCAAAVTNADGRTEHALFGGEAMVAGTYELEFDIGDYFRSKGSVTSETAFLDTVVIRVSLNAAEQYHVPLLVSPWSYSTYRGS
jgi:5-hydroxyisourate hydrolase